MKLDLWKLVVAIVICQLAGVIGAVFTSHSVSTWYQTLVKPSFVPPDWIFGPVWITLYTLMGISLYLIYTTKTDKGSEKDEAIAFFILQLFLNIVWSLLFFGLRFIFAGLIVIILLLLAILGTAVSAYRVNKAAGLILIPYILWVGFATALNYYIWVLN